MEMSSRMAKRILPGAMTQSEVLFDEVLGPLARSGSQRRRGSRVEVMPTQCTAWPKSLLRILWCSVICVARASIACHD
jgi:hypothetical protein